MLLLLITSRMGSRAYDNANIPHNFLSFRKSTFFNVLTKASVPAENFPFCTIDPSENKSLTLKINTSPTIGYSISLYYRMHIPLLCTRSFTSIFLFHYVVLQCLTSGLIGWSSIGNPLVLFLPSSQLLILPA